MVPVVFVDADKSFTENLIGLIRSLGTEAQAFNNSPKYLRSKVFNSDHVAVISLSMPDVDGLDVLKASIVGSSASAVFGVLDEPSVALAVQAVKFGAENVFVKPFSVEPLVEAANRKLNNPQLPTLRLIKSSPLDLTALSKREREVLQELLDGHNAKDIGKRLDISARTVEVHRRRVYAKLKVASQVELIKRYSHSSNGRTLV